MSMSKFCRQVHGDRAFSPMLIGCRPLFAFLLVISPCFFHDVCAAASAVIAWGDNRYGQTNVPPDLTNIVDVAAGALHSMALKVDGTLVTWGDNSWGQRDAPGGLMNVVGIAAGLSGSAALRDDGT